MTQYLKLLRRYKLFWKVIPLMLFDVMIIVAGNCTVKAVQLVVSDFKNPLFWVFLVGTNLFTIAGTKCFFRATALIRENFQLKYRNDLFSKVVRMPMEKLQELDMGKITTAIHHAEDISDNITELPGGFIEVIIGFISTVILMLLQDWKLTSILLIEVIPIGILLLKMKTYIKEMQKEKRATDTKLDTCINRIPRFLTIKAYSGEEYESKNFKNLSRDFRKISLQKKVTNQNLWTIARSVFAGIDITVLIYAMITRMSISDILLFYGLSQNLAYPFLNLPNMLDAFIQFSVNLTVGDELLDEEDEEDGQLTLASFHNEIEFKNVSFAYKESDTVLEDVSLKIPKGSKVGIYGESGAGKSTIANLMMRFFNVSDGSIMIDGIDISMFTHKSLRKKVGIVSQQVELFDDISIRDNICYGITGLTDDQIASAARLANAHDFIMNLPDKYDSMVGNNGVKLSGGQRQRIAIARLFLANPDIIIFDEATSALDNVSERTIKDAIEKLSEGKTVISIAHRFSTIENSDILVGMKNHKIYEVGTKETLNHEGTLFHELYTEEE